MHFLQKLACASDEGIQLGDVWYQYPDPNKVADFDHIDPVAILLGFPFTGFCYAVEEGGLADDVIRELKLRRLQGVSQLAMLQKPGVIEQFYTADGGQYGHNRFVHILDVYALVTLMCNECNEYSEEITEREVLHLKVAALTHDALTPAGGDTTKRINITMFDEDATFRFLYGTEGWKALQKKYNLDEDLLFDIIQGKGKLGRLLDLADKIAYVSRDVYGFICGLHKGYFDELSTLRYAIRGIVSGINGNPEVCNIWDSVKIVDGVPVVCDILGLCAFLMVRALMFRSLYYCPRSRFLEDFLGRAAIEYLLESGKLTKAKLLQMVDRQLLDIIEQEVFHVPDFFTRFSVQYEPHAEAFATEAEMLARERVVADITGSISTVSVAKSLSTNGIASFKVYGDHKVMTLGQAMPKAVETIAAAMHDPTPFRLYWFIPGEIKLPKQLVAKLAKERKQRLALPHR